MPLHACMNCRHYVPRGALRCLLPGAPRVLDAKAANKCSLFEFVNRTEAVAKEAAAAFESGNGDSTPTHDTRSPRDRWESLFEGDTSV